MERGRCTGSGWIIPGAKDYRPPRLANTPTISQATPDSFLPRWGKKPYGLAVYEGDCQAYEPPLCKGRWLPEGQTEGLYVTSLAKYNPSAPTGQLPLHKGAYTGGFSSRWTAKTDDNILVFLAGGAWHLGAGDAAKPTSAPTSRPAPRR